MKPDAARKLSGLAGRAALDGNGGPMLPTFHSFPRVIVLIAIFTLAARADDSPPEPTPDTAKGAIKLFCHRLAAGDVDKAIALCPVDTSDDDKALIKYAVECYAAYEQLKKAALDKFGPEQVDEKFNLYGPRP